MAEGRLASGLAVSRLGPFHGDGEGVAKVYVWLMAAEGLMLLVLPWVVVMFSVFYHHGRGLHPVAPILYFRLGVLDVLGIVSAFSFWTLWKRLSVKIAEGGSEARFLDKTRTHIASLMGGMVMMMLIAAVFFSR